MKTGTKMEAIERVKGFCTKVDSESWGVLVDTVSLMGIEVGEKAMNHGPTTGFPYAGFVVGTDKLSLSSWAGRDMVIPFPDFLAKLRGEEWQPKAGEMVEVSHDGINWLKREFIALKGAWYWCFADDDVRRYAHIRPIRPTITRAEAE
jgi:hypothetical protein